MFKDNLFRIQGLKYRFVRELSQEETGRIAAGFYVKQGSYYHYSTIFSKACCSIERCVCIRNSPTLFILNNRQAGKVISELKFKVN